MREIKFFFAAVLHYTRIPVPRMGYDRVCRQHASRYLPAIGCVVGCIVAVVLQSAMVIFSPSIAVILSMLAGLWSTGALHEDGLADSADAFGGGRDKNTILTILKDSRIGAYGAIALIMALLLKWALLVDMTHYADKNLFLVLIAAHSGSRFMAFTTMITHDYVRTSASKSDLLPMAFWRRDTAVACLVAALPWFFLSYWTLVAWGAMWLVKLSLSAYFRRWIGGYTGDCLGAIQQCCELTCYATILIIWKYIG